MSYPDAARAGIRLHSYHVVHNRFLIFFACPQKGMSRLDDRRSPAGASPGGKCFPPRLPGRRLGGTGERISAICCARSWLDQAEDAPASRAAFFGSFLAEQERTKHRI